MILMLFLLAPTVPSDPRPQNLQETVPGLSVSGCSGMGRLRPVTSSVMPMVKPFFGSAASSSRYTARICPGSVSLLERP